MCFSEIAARKTLWYKSTQTHPQKGASMNVTFRPVDDCAKEILANMCRSIYLEGECYAFAIAVHRGTDLPIYGLMENSIVLHAVVLLPDDRYLDARGPVNARSVGDPFNLRQPVNIVPVDEARLFAQRHIGDISIRRAGFFAEALWPELPWKNPLCKRVAAFVKDLDRISRKHKFFIRAPVPGARPVLAPAEGNEQYELQLTDCGTTYLIDRALVP
jgi:hypothetical protein